MLLQPAEAKFYSKWLLLCQEQVEDLNKLINKYASDGIVGLNKDGIPTKGKYMHTEFLHNTLTLNERLIKRLKVILGRD